MNKKSTDDQRVASQACYRISEDGTKSWWQDDQLHRDGGPAIEQVKLVWHGKR